MAKKKSTWTKISILMTIFNVIGWINWWLMFMHTAKLFNPLKLYEKYENISSINNIIIVSTIIVLGTYILIIVPKTKENGMTIFALVVLLPMYIGFVAYAIVFEIRKQKMPLKKRKDRLITFYVAFLSLNTIASLILLIVSFIFYWDEPYNIINIITIVAIIFTFLLQVWLNIEFTTDVIYKKFYKNAQKESESYKLPAYNL